MTSVTFIHIFFFWGGRLRLLFIHDQNLRGFCFHSVLRLSPSALKNTQAFTGTRANHCHAELVVLIK